MFHPLARDSSAVSDECHAVTPEESLDGSEAKAEALPDQGMTHLLDGGVPGRSKCLQNGIMVRFDAPGAVITAQGLGTSFAFFALPLPPPADARRADPKAFAGFAMCSPASTAARTRTLRSSDSAFDMPAGLHSGRQYESPPS